MDCRCRACGCCKHDHRGWRHEWTSTGDEMDQKPSIGRIVHYVSYGTPGGEYTKQCRAAIVTQISDDGTVGLAVMNPTGQFFNPSVMADFTENQGGTWHWPERV